MHVIVDPNPNPVVSVAVTLHWDWSVLRRHLIASYESMKFYTDTSVVFFNKYVPWVAYSI